jgi:5-methylcytosine-specific restriction enzyme subunit McrC
MCIDVERTLRHELLLTADRMRGVSRLPLTSGVFRRIQLSRNTLQYGLLMRICEMVFHGLMPDEEGRESRFLNILDDEVRMSGLFEEFLREFYGQELPGYRAASQIMSWDASSNVLAHLAHLPVMRTDISIRSQERLIIVDAKYYRELMAKGAYGERIRAEHLYQLTAYLAHARLRNPGLELSGMLLYPSTNRSVDWTYTLLGTPVRIATVDLSEEWRAIHERLLGLVIHAETTGSPVAGIALG